MSYRLIGTATDPQTIADCLNKRRQELGLTLSELDDVLGLAPRYASKIFAHNYQKSLGALSLPTMLEALGVRLLLVADDRENALPPITRRAIREKSLSPCKIEAQQRHTRPVA
jgi:hypothetical protein